MRIAVTGGNGDVGSVLVPYLTDRGHEVVSIDLALPRGAAFPGNPAARHMIADVTDYGQLAGCLHGCEAVIHLAAIRAPIHYPDHEVYRVNTVSSYNVLSAAAALGIGRVCLASSINAIGGVFSRQPRFDYFPVDEQHPTYCEDSYSLSKWVLEQQADAFARRYAALTIASLRFHWVLPSAEEARMRSSGNDFVRLHLWAYTEVEAAARACLLAITVPFAGHEVFFISAPHTAVDEPSLDLARRHYPDTPIRGDLSGTTSFYNCAKAERILGWKHDEA